MLNRATAKTAAKPTNQPAIYGNVQAGQVVVQVPITHRKRDGAFDYGITRVFGKRVVVSKRVGADVRWAIVDGRKPVARELMRSVVRAQSSVK